MFGSRNVQARWRVKYCRAPPTAPLGPNGIPLGPTGEQIEKQTGLTRDALLAHNPHLFRLWQERTVQKGDTSVGVTPHLLGPYLVDIPNGQGEGKTFECYSNMDLTPLFSGFDEAKGRFDQVSRELMTYAECHLVTGVRSVPMMLTASQIAANQAGVFISPPPSQHGNPCPLNKFKGASLAELQGLPIDWRCRIANGCQCLVDTKQRVDTLDLQGLEFTNSGNYSHELRAKGNLTVADKDVQVKERRSNSAFKDTYTTLGDTLPLLRTTTHVDVVTPQHIPCPETSRVEQGQCVRWLDTPYFAKDNMLYLPEDAPHSALCKEVGVFRHLLFRGIDLYLVILHDDTDKIYVVSTSGVIPPAEACSIQEGLRMTLPVPEVFPPFSKKKRKAGGGAASSPSKKARAETLDGERKHAQLMANGGGGSGSSVVHPGGTHQQHQDSADVLSDTELTTQHAIAAGIGQQHSFSAPTSSIRHSTAATGSSGSSGGSGDSGTPSPLSFSPSPEDSLRAQADPSVDDLLKDDNWGTDTGEQSDNDELLGWYDKVRQSSSYT